MTISASSWRPSWTRRQWDSYTVTRARSQISIPPALEVPLRMNAELRRQLLSEPIEHLDEHHADLPAVDRRIVL